MQYGGITESTFHHAEFKLATNTALSDFPNMEAKRKNCLKHLVRRIDVFAILPTDFGKSLIFQLLRMWMKPLKVEAVKLYTEVPDHGCLRNGKRTARRKAWKATCGYHY